MAKRWKNHYVKNAHISEKLFENILWGMINDLTANYLVEYYSETETPITRQSINRYWQMVGDWMFNLILNTEAESDVLRNQNKWPMILLALHQSLYPNLYPDHKMSQAILRDATNFFQSVRAIGI